jgi:Asp-tRNA(Asn)/Glu-tRNA(Gln) amidotransferase A subunit family amidase
VRRIAVFEEDALQPVSRACRAAVRRAAAVLADHGIEIAHERPPRAAELCAAFDAILNHELATTSGPLMANPRARAASSGSAPARARSACPRSPCP